MDPLSVTASIVGILAAAYKIGELLNGTISTAKDAPSVLTALASEIREIQAVLPSLQVLLINLSSARPDRAAMIQLDQLIVTLTAAALTLAELEKAIAPFMVEPGVKIPIRVKLRWTRAESNCMKIVERLQRHKASMSLMLNILQCTSDAEASRSQSSLESMVEQLLQSNQQLCKRLQNLEDSFDARSILSERSDSLSLASEADNATITTAHPAANKRVSILEAVRVRFAFDDALQSSRVYNRVKSDACGHSLLSSAVRTQTWSIFSGLSLADISVISVIALPLYPEDVKTHAEYYMFGDPEPAGVETTATWTNNQHLIDAHAAPEPLASSSEVNESEQWPLSDEDLENTPTETHFPLLPTTSSPSESIPAEWPLPDGDNYTTPSDTSDAYSSNTEDPSSASSFDSGPSRQVHVDTLRDLEAGLSLTTLNTAMSDDSSHPMSPTNYSDEEDEWEYPCKGCGEILEEGKAFELNGNRWHLDCFRCNTCGTLLDSDANLLLLGDGSLICNNCTYACNHCGNRIEDLAILTGDQAYCANCFRCRNCKRKIENLRYARTSQGIFCMGCHESLMARRRKKAREKNNVVSQVYDKSLPPLPPSGNNM